MHKEDIYNCFVLNSKLHQTVTNWIKNKVKNTHYEDCSIVINDILNIGSGQIKVILDFQVPPCYDYIEESYILDVTELENY